MLPVANARRRAGALTAAVGAATLAAFAPASAQEPPAPEVVPVTPVPVTPVSGDTYQAMIVPGAFSAFGVFLMRQFFVGIPRSLDDAAILDGANHFEIFRRVCIPLSKPAIATLVIFAFVGSWNDFLWPLIIINSVEKLVLSVGLSHFQDLYYTEWTLLMAASVMAMAPVLLVYGLAQRYFVQGIALTGIKG